MQKNFHLLLTVILLLSKLSYTEAQSQNWSLLGNTGTTPGTNFLGTTDSKAFVIKTNNIERMRITNAGRIGIGINNPAVSLHVSGGALRIDQASGTQGFVILNSNGLSNPQIEFRQNNVSQAAMRYDQAKQALGVYLGPLDTAILTINKSNGFVGIGKDVTPLYPVDVKGASRFIGNMGIQAPPDTNTLRVGNVTGSAIGIGTAERIADGGTNNLAISGTLRPLTDNTYGLGFSKLRWTSVWAVNGVIQTSDARDKTNIRNLNYGLKEIMQLHTVRYNWKDAVEEGDKLGIVAQEIQQVLPEVVRNWDYSIDEQTGKKTKVTSDKLGVAYSDIIPVLINSIQEQQKEIEDLKRMVQQLTNSISGNQNATVSKTGSFMQSTPNPFSNNTTISYNLDAGFKTAQIIVSDNAGRTIKVITLTTNKGNVVFDGSKVPAGSYHYSLVADGKIIEAKTMIVSK